jgi:hypothetical protein
VLVAVFAQGGVLRNPNEGLCGQIPNITLRAIASLYIEPVPLIWNREEKEARGPTLHHVSRVLFVVLMGRDTGHPYLLAPNLLTGGKGADLVIRGNVVLNRDLALFFNVPCAVRRVHPDQHGGALSTPVRRAAAHRRGPTSRPSPQIHRAAAGGILRRARRSHLT